MRSRMRACLQLTRLYVSPLPLSALHGVDVRRRQQCERAAAQRQPLLHDCQVTQGHVGEKLPVPATAVTAAAAAAVIVAAGAAAAGAAAIAGAPVAALTAATSAAAAAAAVPGCGHCRWWHLSGSDTGGGCGGGSAAVKA
eukprot:352517-Chlamydomonas_euryale.AAC.1